MKILAVGDSYTPVSVFEEALAPLAAEHELSFQSIDEVGEYAGAEQGVREYLGRSADLASRLGDHEVLIVHAAPVTDAVLGASPRLALVCCARGGPVNIDLAAASRRKIPVVTTPGKNAEAVADLTLALCLMLARGLPAAVRFAHAARDLGQSTFEGAPFLGRDLGGQTIGLVGFGQVGTRVARRALAFGMSVLVYDPWVEPARIDGPGIRACGLNELLAEAEFVSLHARFTAENANLFNRDRFEMMRSGAFFVNTARETLVDEDALHEALVSGRLAGAALDVVRPRVGGRAHPLAALEQVILTPHIGGCTRETLVRGARMIADEVRRFAAGLPLVHVINREALG